VSAAVVAIITENVVIAFAIGAGWHLLRQGGGLQVKTPPAPKAPARTQQEADKPLRSAA